MAIVQCPKFHYYDDKRNTECPYCLKESQAVTGEVSLNEQLTSYIALDEEDNAQLTEAYGESVADYEKTIGIFVDESQNRLTAAWLVCQEGFEKGKSYVIYSGRNFAGSAPHMDIVLAEAPEIFPEKHFSIVYDPRSVAFYVVCGEGHTYVNGEAVSSQIAVADGDIIQAGDSKYIFVPFCKEGREWN